MILSCPGAQRFKQPQPEIIKCRFCNEELEIWTDESEATCPKCSAKVLRNESSNCCLDWCEYAKTCVGEQNYNNYMKNRTELAGIKYHKKVGKKFIFRV